MKKITRLCPLFGLLFSMNVLTSQTTHVPEFIQWTEFTNSTKLSEKFGIYTEVGFRFVVNNGVFQTEQHQFRIGPEIYVDKHLTIMPVGYVYTINNNYELTGIAKPYANNEHRVFSQITYKHQVGRIQFQHRFRYEWRFTQVHRVDSDSVGTIFDDGYTNYKNRVRYRLSANIGINHKTLEPNTWYIRVWDEFMVAFADPIVYPTFKVEQNFQNRVFIGGGYQIIKPISITLGLVYQMQTKNNGTYVEHNIGPFLSFNFSPNLTEVFKTKKKE